MPPCDLANASINRYDDRAHIYILEVAFIGAAAIVAINLDNLLLSINMAQAEGIKRAAAVFLSIQLLFIALALRLSRGLEGLPTYWIGYPGFLPIALGIRELLKKDSSESVAPVTGIIRLPWYLLPIVGIH